MARSEVLLYRPIEQYRKTHDHARGIAEAFAITPRFLPSVIAGAGMRSLSHSTAARDAGRLVLHEAAETKYSPLSERTCRCGTGRAVF
jgi:hypothetical protein